MRKTGEDRPCAHCGANFYVPGWRAKDNPKFCSMSCLWAGRKARPQRRPSIELICQRCGTLFLVRPYAAKAARFCSRSCTASASMKVRHAERRILPSNSLNKVCSRCGIEKPRTEFFSRPDNPDALRADCKACFGATTKTRLSIPENAEKKRLANRAYHEREAERINREARERYADPMQKALIQAQNKASRDRNPETMQKYNRARRQTNGDAIRAARRQHYQDNKPAYKAASRARNKHVKQATPPWSDLKAIEALYAQAERVSRVTGVPHHVDHFYPLRAKTMCGLHVSANLRIAPDVVNLKKGNSIPIDVGPPLCCAWPMSILPPV